MSFILDDEIEELFEHWWIGFSMGRVDTARENDCLHAFNAGYRAAAELSRQLVKASQEIEVTLDNQIAILKSIAALEKTHERIVQLRRLLKIPTNDSEGSEAVAP